MKPEEIRKLLGGYATGTLTEAERETLFAAALDDQELFNELAAEEPLRELLSDPGARAEMLAAVEPKPRVWAWWRPAAAALAVATIGTVMVLLPRRKAIEPAPPAPPPAIVAEVKPAPEPPLAKEESRPAPPKRTPKVYQPPVAPEPPKEVATLSNAPKPSAPQAVGGVVGGTPGGVLGGIIGSPRAASPAAPPPPPPPPAPNFRSSFSSTRETVEVTAAAPLLAITPTPRTLFFSAQNPGIRYTVVRDPDAGTVALRITANVNGFVSLAGAEPVSLTAMRPYTTAPLEGSEVQLVFARTPMKALTGPAPVLTETVAGEVYVVTATPGPEIGFTIPLTPK